MTIVGRGMGRGGSGAIVASGMLRSNPATQPPNPTVGGLSLTYRLQRPTEKRPAMGWWSKLKMRR